MHSFNGKTCNIHYNPDLSGYVTINNNNRGTTYGELEIDPDDLIEFLAQLVRERLKEKYSQSLDERTDRDILGL